MLSIASSVPLSALYAAAASFFIAVLLVATKQWHGAVTLDPTVGVQKIHLAPTPRVGGIAILAGLLLGCQFATREGQALLWPLIVAGLPAFAFGLLEDITKRVSVRTRLLATMACGVLAWSLTGLSITSIQVPGVDWLLSLTLVSVLFTAFAVGGVANAINIIDGFNGLAAGTVLVILAAFWAVASSLGDTDLTRACMIVAGAVAGFALLNWPFGKLFLGDGGAYFVGFAIAWLSVLLSVRHPQLSPWAPLVICGYPILEVLFSIVRRHRRSRSAGAADRLHLHSLIKRRLVRRLLPGPRTLLRNSVTGAIMWGAALLPAVVGVYWSNNAPLLVLGLACCAALYSIAYARLTQFRWCWPATSRRSDAPRPRERDRIGSRPPAPAGHSLSQQPAKPIRISVITATWNSASTIVDALDSVNRQTYPTVEQIWVDGASTDGTLELLEARRGRGQETLVSEPDGGIYDALNKGLRRATGDVVGFLHADDMLADAHVLTRVASAFADPTVGAVYGDLEYVRKDDPSSVVRRWRAGHFERRKLARGWMPPHPTLYLRREIYEQYGTFNEAFRIAADYDLVLRIFSRPGLNPVYLPEVLVKMRTGGISNRSLSNIWRKSNEDLRALRCNRVGGIGALVSKNLSKVKQFRLDLPGREIVNTPRRLRAFLHRPTEAARKGSE